MKQFIDVLNRSQYVLCPRGYGPTSFRIQEALQYNAIPVYISDNHIIPHGDFSYGLLRGIGEPLNLTPVDITGAYQKYFTYEANKKIIIQNIN